MKWRIKLCLNIFMLQMGACVFVARFLMGSEGIKMLFAELLKIQSGAIERAAKFGAVREARELQKNLDQMAAALRPDCQWTFHKETWGDCEVVVMPRVIDSNTGVVTGPAGHPALGAVVTNDHQAPNCDPSSLNQMINGQQVPA